MNSSKPNNSSNLTIQKARWTIEKIQSGLEKFYKEYNRYPTSTEFDEFEYLPSSRQIQRRFGGLVELRKQLKLTGQHDFTEGAYSSNRATEINKKASEVLKEVSTYLIGIYGEAHVDPEFFFTDDHRSKTNFFVTHKGGSFAVDILNPKDRHNLVGCINSKLKTYEKYPSMPHQVVFVVMNENLDQETISRVVENKKKKIYSYIKVVSFDEFKKFCKERKAL